MGSVRCQDPNRRGRAGAGTVAAMVVAVLALLLQQLAVPLHLTWHEHHAPEGLATHGHSHVHHGTHHAHVGHHHAHVGHHHGTDASSPREPFHEPHPLDDHRDETTATTAPRTASVTGELAVALPSCEVLLGDAHAVAASQEVEPTPRPPPPVRSTGPRGPPSPV
jgi:hypothetical protein